MSYTDIYTDPAEKTRFLVHNSAVSRQYSVHGAFVSTSQL